MKIVFIKMFALLQEFVHDKFNYNLPGFGILLNSIKSDKILNVKGKKLFFDHQIADNYLRLIAGRFNEPETHVFIDNVLNKINQNIQFIDIGANVGEFILDYSDREKIDFVHAFEPQKIQFSALQNTKELNKFDKLKLINKPVSDKAEKVLFNVNAGNSTSSGITKNQSQDTIAITATFIDNENLPNITAIILIDVEGSELKVMQGGRKYIAEHKPLIIFEYNYVTKEHFSIADVEKELGTDYEIFRLKNNGKLDKDFSNPWNLVALNKTSIFNDSVKEMIQ